MKKIFKIVIISLVALVAVALVAPAFISKDLIKEKLIAQVKQATGRTLAIDGGLSLRFFPFAGVTAEKVSLSDSDGKKGTFVALESLKLDVEVMPLLLRKELVIKTLVLREPEINLHVAANGTRNWEFAPAQPTETVPSKSTASSPVSGSVTLPGNIRLSDVNILDGAVRYRDDRNKGSWEIDHLDLGVILNGIDNPLTLKGKGEWQKKTIKVRATVDTLGNFLANEKTKMVLDVSSDVFAVSLDGMARGLQYAGKASIASPSLIMLQTWINPASKPSLRVPLALDVKGNMYCDTGRCEFDKTSIVLDAIKAQGKASINFGGHKPAITVDLATDALDLNPFLPAESRPKADNGSFGIATAYAESGEWSHEPMDFSALNAVDLISNIRTKRLLVKNIKIGEAIFRAKIQGGRLSADVIEARLYGGTGTIALNADAASHVVEYRLNVTGVEAEPFLKDAMDEERLSGKAVMQVNTVTHGRSQYDLMSNLQGSGQLKFLDGAIRGVDLAGMVRNLQSAYKTVDTSRQKTDFAELGGTFTIINGVVKNNDLAMKAPLMRLSGAGEVNLPARTINYRLKPEIVQTIQGQGGKEKEGLGVPVIIEGSLDNPSYRPDLAAVAEEALKDPQKIKDTVKSVKEQFKGENKKETIKSLKGLLKGF